MLVEPGFFRTELLTDDSSKWPEPTIDDYAETTRQTDDAWKKMSGLQGGDPARLAKALVQLTSLAEPPLRWPAGADAVEAFEKKARELLAQANASPGAVFIAPGTTTPSRTNPARRSKGQGACVPWPEPSPSVRGTYKGIMSR